MITEKELEFVKSEAIKMGYTFEEVIENGILIVKMYRKDGSLVFKATKPVPTTTT